MLADAHVGREFQSAPLTEARGDADPRDFARLVECFNPLPSPKQGETCPTRRDQKRILRFNPLPSPKQGETKVAPASGAIFAAVSIRSPHRSKGRLFVFGRDHRLRNGFNPLPSPKQGETSKPRPCGLA